MPSPDGRAHVLVRSQLVCYKSVYWSLRWRPHVGAGTNAAPTSGTLSNTPTSDTVNNAATVGSGTTPAEGKAAKRAAAKAAKKSSDSATNPAAQVATAGRRLLKAAGQGL